jgi:8-oxo-dGTP pyrophosphatase MutT (NUDIX family)
MKSKKILPWKTLHSKIVFDHHWYKVRQDTVQLPNGKILDDYFVSVRDDVAIVFPITSDGKIITVTQYKHGASEIVTELPAGFFNRDEQPLIAAKRELAEETGFESRKWTLLAKTRDNPTKDSNQFYLYLAENCEPTGTQDFDENEDISVESHTPQEILTMIHNGTIHVHSMITIIYLAFKKLGLNQ